jgi:hypothetical protein
VWLNKHFAAMGYEVFGQEDAASPKTPQKQSFDGRRSLDRRSLDRRSLDRRSLDRRSLDRGDGAVVVTVDFGGEAKKRVVGGGGGGRGKAQSEFSTLSLNSHPLPPSTFRRSSWKHVKSLFVEAGSSDVRSVATAAAAARRSSL